MLDGDGAAAHLREQLAPLGPVVIRRMFGGAGVFLDGLMFALIADGILYLKSDEASRADFEAEGLGPFAYAKSDGRTTVMSYWRAPERLVDDDEEMLAWARKAVAAARRGAARAPRGGKARSIGSRRP